MGKDPAFLFYPGDWLGGTMGMSLEEKGAYMELLILQFNRGSFSEEQAIRIIGSSNWDIVKLHFKLNIEGLYYNERLNIEKEKRSNFVESRRRSRTKSDEDNVRIYIVRDNVRLTYKIGSSVNPMRRYNELSNQIDPAIMADEKGQRDITLVWYSNPVKRTEEGNLHKLFEDKRIAGEWFKLNDNDLELIYNKYTGNYIERTNERTENENEDENENISKSRKKRPFKKPTLDEVKGYFDENGYSEDAAIRAFNYYSVADWHDSKGNKVKNWKQKMQSVWFKDENKKHVAKLVM